MRHTKALTKRPAQAQSAYASKLQFKQAWSRGITTGIAMLGDAFANSLGLGLNIVKDNTTTT